MVDSKTSFMRQALDQAVKSAELGEVPVGAVVVDAGSGEVIGVGGNRVIDFDDPTAHAEIVALRRASALMGAARLEDCDIYVTLEPCPMCAGAISLARVRRLYFGAYDAKGGGVEHGSKVFDQPTCHHKPEVIGGLEETAAGELLKDFFRERR
ncbi:MAG: nucleoside deaminase [Rhodospirillales bacterium]